MSGWSPVEKQSIAKHLTVVNNGSGWVIAGCSYKWCFWPSTRILLPGSAQFPISNENLKQSFKLRARLWYSCPLWAVPYFPRSLEGRNDLQRGGNRGISAFLPHSCCKTAVYVGRVPCALQRMCPPAPCRLSVSDTAGQHQGSLKWQHVHIKIFVKHLVAYLTFNLRARPPTTSSE